MRYDLAAMAGNRRRKRIILRPIYPSVGAETEYLNVLRAMLRALAEEAKESILPAAEYELTQHRSTIVADAMPFGLFNRFLTRAATLATQAGSLVRNILGLEARRHTSKWVDSVKAAIGIDVSAVVSQEGLSDYLENANERNVGLISKLATDAVDGIKTAVMNAILQGKTADQLKGELKERFDISDRRAKLIARDQVSKLTSDLNRRRHTEAGISEYVWTTSHDERVRALHKSLDGKEYKYGEPTGAEQGLPPGQPINCRCVGRAIVIIGGERFT